MTFGFIIPFLAGIFVGVVVTIIFLLPDIIITKCLTKDEAEKIIRRGAKGNHVKR